MNAHPPLPDPEDPLAQILASAPPEAWRIAVKTASDIVRDVLAPLTSTTAGLGRLIQGKFDSFIELQRVLAADTLRRTNEKIQAGGSAMKPEFNPSVVITCMEESSKQTEPEIRDLWANLLARELTAGGIHPELPRILGRMTAADAKELIKISNSPPIMRGFREPTRRSYLSAQIALHTRGNHSFNTEILRTLGLVERDEGDFEISGLGRALLEAVAPFNEEVRAGDEEETESTPEA